MFEIFTSVMNMRRESPGFPASEIYVCLRIHPKSTLETLSNKHVDVRLCASYKIGGYKEETTRQ